jgi:hypothetical protein
MGVGDRGAFAVKLHEWIGGGESYILNPKPCHPLPELPPRALQRAAFLKIVQTFAGRRSSRIRFKKEGLANKLVRGQQSGVMSWQEIKIRHCIEEPTQGWSESGFEIKSFRTF